MFSLLFYLLPVRTRLEDQILFSVFCQDPIIEGHLDKIINRFRSVLIICSSPVEFGVVKEAKTVWCGSVRRGRSVTVRIDRGRTNRWRSLAAEVTRSGGI